MVVKFMNGIDAQSQRIQSVGSPSVGTDAANKTYVDNVAQGLTWKNDVRVASTGNITVAAPGSTIDGTTMVANDRVLLKNQTTGAENGIYLWNTAATPMTRTTDADTGSELNAGVIVSVVTGTANAAKAYMITSPETVTIGTTTSVWSVFGGGQTYTGSNGVLLTGTNFTAVADTGILVTSSGIKVDTSIVVRKYAANVPAQTSPVFTHNLGTRDVQISVYDTTTFEEVQPDKIRTDANNVTLGFAVAPGASAYRVVIQG